MFTGIIEAVGQIESVQARSGDKRFKINTGKLVLSDVALGDSIACNGVCLTVVAFDSQSYTADVSGESLKLTTLGHLKAGDSCNLEKALTPTTRLGGHLVSGHVDGLGEVVSVRHESRSIQYWIKAPKDLARYIAKKGSITVDGISLTVNELNDDQFMLNLVPHTLQETNAKDWQAGVKVNLEVDLLARYLERLLQGRESSPQSSLNYQMLMENGFIK